MIIPVSGIMISYLHGWTIIPDPGIMISLPQGRTIIPGSGIIVRTQDKEIIIPDPGITVLTINSKHLLLVVSGGEMTVERRFCRKVELRNPAHLLCTGIDVEANNFAAEKQSKKRRKHS